MVIIVDDEDRENEGDICIAAEFVTPEIINFMATEARGLICVPMMASRLRELQLGLMVQENTARLTTAFTVSVDAVKDVSTGISVHDRAATVKSLIDPETKPEDLARPGHIFPLKYCEGGVLVRAGQTEAIVDLARIAGKYPAGVICEVMSEDGTMSRLPELERFSKKHSIGIVTVAQIIEYRRNHEKIIERVAEARIPTIFGEFEAISYRSIVDKDEHVALVMGDVTTDESTLVRVHSECLTSDVFSSLRCDCGEQLNLALEMIGKEGRGVFLYMRQEGRGIGIHEKLKAYHLQDDGLDTVDANIHLGFAPDLRHYGVGVQILQDVGVTSMRIMTNNPRKLAGLSGYGELVVTERVPIIVDPIPENISYLETKKKKLGHMLDKKKSD
ncbi:MAG: bifunctional 3,4-dihydroxy-2-butanone-4-phosphate synthase/GTP cyclohydrolase II [SAR202 cluster bacterium]|nr:bifunctional 3,4-dihydroxy-2-butanone-4-phosphate synthase/GTP cyclohydrolase II [SAR202 cluster bacterium]